MFEFSALHSADEPTRREFMLRLARTCLGVTVTPLAMPLMSVRGALAGGGKAKHVIYLFMEGAMSQLDTFDPKPGRDVQGSTGVVQTSVPGIQLSEHLPKLAHQIKKLAVVRSLSAETGAHAPGQYMMRTSYKEIASIRHPGLGAWSQKILGKISQDLPGNVVIGNSTGHPGSGFLDARVAPVPVGDPAAGLQNTQQPKYLLANQFDRRMKLTNSFDAAFERKYKHREVQAYSELYQEAIKLLKSQELKAFDINAETEKSREAYGTSTLGKACLLARRLVEHGVRFVEITYGSWDLHRDVFRDMPGKAGPLDQALSTLLADLEAKKMLDSTLVVVATEFGRTPRINENTGRDHHPGAFSCVLAGGGIQGGRTYGESDKDSQSVKDDRIGVADFNATIAQALGLPLEQEFYSPSKRPFKVAHDGTPIVGLF